ncbi:hypothetical protein BHE74_00032736 [Ensete ventricosum]|nr:hypothetical protein BHE74_00032736 [Ensete ventricosum]
MVVKEKGATLVQPTKEEDGSNVLFGVAVKEVGACGSEGSLLSRLWWSRKKVRRCGAPSLWQREIAAIKACSVVQAMMLAAIEGEKGDGGNGRSSYGLRAGSSTTGEEKDFNGRWMRGYKRRQPTTTWLVDEEEGGGRWKETLIVSCKQ